MAKMRFETLPDGVYENGKQILKFIKSKQLNARLIARYFEVYKMYLQDNGLDDDSNSISVKDLIDFVENNIMKSFQSVVGSFATYGDRVMKILKRKEPNAEFTMQFLASCYGHGISPTVAANAIIKNYKQENAKNNIH